MFKEEFYLAVRKDFQYQVTKSNSFLCQYLKKEKESDVRISLKRNALECRDTPEERRAFAKVMAEALLTDTRLQKLYAELGAVFVKLGLDFGTDEVSKKKNQTARIRTALRCFLEKMNDPDQTDIPTLATLQYVTRGILEKIPDTSQRKDLYIVLLNAYLDYQMQYLSKQRYLRELLLLLGSKTKLQLSGQSRETILALGKSLGGETFFEGVRKDQDKCQKLFELLDSNQSDGEQCDLIDDEEIRRITEEILDFILQLDARTFLYDIGYPVNSGGRTKEDADQVDGEFEWNGDETQGVSRKKDRTMDMLSDYCEKNNIHFHQQEGVNFERKLDDPEYREACERLFEQLKKEGQDKVFIPLEIDPASGAGVYIIGRKNYPVEFKKRRKMEEACCCRCLVFESVSMDKDAEDREIVNLVMSEMSLRDDDGTLEGAVREFKGRVENCNVFSGYHDTNEQIPKDCHEYFRIYFDTEIWCENLQEEQERNRELLRKEEEQERLKEERRRLRKPQNIALASEERRKKLLGDAWK